MYALILTTLLQLNCDLEIYMSFINAHVMFAAERLSLYNLAEHVWRALCGIILPLSLYVVSWNHPYPPSRNITNRTSRFGVKNVKNCTGGSLKRWASLKIISPH